VDGEILEQQKKSMTISQIPLTEAQKGVSLRRNLTHEVVKHERKTAH